MASVFNRGTKQNPKWYANYKDLDGIWKQVNTRQPSKEAAKRYVAELEARVARGLVGIPEVTPEEQAAKTLSVLDLCTRFVAEYSRPKIKDIEAYRKQARWMVNRLVKPFPLASMLAASVDALDVEMWRDRLLSEGYKPNTVNRTMGMMSKVFSWARKHRHRLLSGANPFPEVERMPYQDSEEHYSMEELHRLLARPECPAMVWTAAYTGMRKGELFGLTWACVRLDGELPRIEVKKSYRTTPKTPGSIRTLPIHPDLLPKLRQWKEQCPETSEGLVFPVAVLDTRARAVGWRMGDEDDIVGLPELLKAADVHVPVALSTRGPDRQRAWHAFRHTFGTHFMEASGNGDAQSKLLGHSQGRISGQAAMSMKYTHTSLAYLARELAKMTLLPPSEPGVISIQERKRKRAAAE